jgi:hypothetical protein
MLMPHPPSSLSHTLTESSNFHLQKSKALQSIEQNLKTINDSLQRPSNFKKFFWTPDLAVCGFGTPDEIRQTLYMLKVDDEYAYKY